MRFMKEQFENELTGEIVDGITIMLEGELKEAFNIIQNKSEKYNNDLEIMKDVVLLGIKEVISSTEKD